MTLTDLQFPQVCYVPLWLPNWFPGVAGGKFAIKARANIVKAITVPFEELKSQKVCSLHLHADNISNSLRARLGSRCCGALFYLQTTG